MRSSTPPAWYWPSSTCTARRSSSAPHLSLSKLYIIICFTLLVPSGTIVDVSKRHDGRAILAQTAASSLSLFHSGGRVRGSWYERPILGPW